MFKHIIFAGLLAALGVYKFLVTEEPWAIGLSQVGILFVIWALVYLAVVKFATVKRSVTNFFQETASPINIAVFRVIFFFYLFYVISGKEVLWYSHFPKELQVAPLGMHWILSFLPINPSLAGMALVIFKTTCLFAMIGLFTRFSTILAAVSGFYVLGIPQFYGSVSHYHHLFWFLVIFSASRCADALSMDAVMQNFKKADRNQKTDIPEASRIYALPLRFIWILLGIAYFFPGFWKLWNSGTAWILGDNMRNHMWLVWISFDWISSLRIDHIPLLCKLAGAGAIFFELNYLFVIFSKRLRFMAPLQALTFHNITYLLLKIEFIELQMCQTTFFNWKKIFEWIGKKLFAQEMTVLYDGSCSFCRRAIGFLQVFDVLGRIKYLDLHAASQDPSLKIINAPYEELMKDMHGVIGTSTSKGFQAYRHIAARIPLLWLVYPFLFLGFVQALGNAVYRNVADHRACRIPPKTTPPPKPEYPQRILIALATILIIGNLVLGFRGIGSGWPFACYPTFSEIAWDKLRTISCEIYYPDGTRQTLPFEFVKEYTGLYKVVGMVSKIYSTKDWQLRNQKFKALWNVFVQSNPKLKSVKTVQFYFLENYSDPAKWHLNPVNKTLAIEFDVDPSN